MAHDEKDRQLARRIVIRMAAGLLSRYTHGEERQALRRIGEFELRRTEVLGQWTTDRLQAFWGMLDQEIARAIDAFKQGKDYQ